MSMHPMLLELVTSFLAVLVCIVVGFYLVTSLCTICTQLSDSGFAGGPQGHHWTIVDLFKPGVYCNICSTSLFYGVQCDYCGVIADLVCVKNADSDLVCKQLSSGGQLVHQWIHGNLPINSTCCSCEKDCGSGAGLVDYRCCWCQRTIHERCRKNFDALCDLGKFAKFIVPPDCVEVVATDSNMVNHRNFKHIRTPEGVDGWKPLIVFANRSSGNGGGCHVLRNMRRLLNPLQVFDLWYDNPTTSLQMLHAFEEGTECYILVAGGDGSFGWVLDAVEAIRYSAETPVRCKMALLPLGTGNDLCRVLGWEANCTDFAKADTIFSLLSNAESTLLDRWLVRVCYSTKLGMRSLEQVRKMNNYLSIGVDAHVALNFHRRRNSIPRSVSGRFMNKMLFVIYGIKDAIERKCRNLNLSVELSLDGHPIELPKLESIVVLNIACWGAGVRPWQLGKSGSEQSMNDGILEVFGIYSTFHIGLMQISLAGPYRIGQAKEVTIKIKKGLFPVQIDGEPWQQGPSTITVTPFGQCSILCAKRREDDGSRRPTGRTKLQVDKSPKH